MEDLEAEGVDQSNQKVRGYKGVDPADYTVSEDDDKTGIFDTRPQGKQELDDAEKAMKTKLNRQAIDAQTDQLGHDAEQMAQREPGKFKFTKQPNGDFSLSNNATVSKPPTPEQDAAMYSTPLSQRRKQEAAPPPPSAPGSIRAPKVIDKSKMQQMDPTKRPSLADPSRDPFKALGESESKFGDASEEYEALKKKYKGAELQQKQQALLKRLKKKK